MDNWAMGGYLISSADLAPHEIHQHRCEHPKKMRNRPLEAYGAEDEPWGKSCKNAHDVHLARKGPQTLFEKISPHKKSPRFRK